MERPGSVGQHAAVQHDMVWFAALKNEEHAEVHAEAAARHPLEVWRCGAVSTGACEGIEWCRAREGVEVTPCTETAEQVA